jgi:hypothetical protein
MSGRARVDSRDAPARRRALALAISACLLLSAALALAADRSEAAFGDLFGIAPVNTAGEQSALVFPGTSAFWAGTCDLASAPIGDIPDGGAGSRPEHVWAPAPLPNFNGLNQAVPAPETPEHCIDFGRLAPPFTLGTRLWREAPEWRLAPVTQAGAHPDGSATMWFRRNPSGEVDGTADNILVDLPPGFVGNPNAVPKCTAEQFGVNPVECPPETQVGVIRLYLVAAGSGGNNYGQGSVEEVLPVYNLEPREGRVAELGFAGASGEDATTVRIVAKARTSGDFGVTTFAAQIPAALPLIAQSITLWGVPWAASHDVWRPKAGWSPPPGGTDYYNAEGEIGVRGLLFDDRIGYYPSWGEVEPFISNPTECTGQPLETRLSTDSYEHQGSFTPDGLVDLTQPTNWRTYTSPAPPVTGCDKVPFDASIDLQPTSTAADSPSGLSAELSIPQNDDLPFSPPPVPPPPDRVPPEQVAEYLAAAEAHWRSEAGLATSQLDRAVVTLPDGVSVNPSGAAGLEACGDAEIGVTNAATNPMLFDDEDPFDGEGRDCPAGSKIGDAQVHTPLLDEPLTGEVVLGTPKSIDPASGQMLRLFVVVRSRARGLIAKIAGSAVADPSTGKLTATFDKSPRVPFEVMRLDLKGGARGLLAMPQRCRSAGWSSLFSPWTAAHGGGGVPVSDSGSFVTDQDCGYGFAPTLSAGMSSRRAAGSGAFTFEIARRDGEQWLHSVSAKLPKGLLASVRDVPLCTSAQAGANACPAASRIGSVNAGAGAGAPFFLERPGSMYLTEGYRGAPFGAVVSVPVEAGPFRGPLALNTIVVRAAIRIDPDTARVTVVSDPFPQIWHGIPLRIRQVTVTVDRPGFMRNPTDCSARRISAAVTSTEGAVATPSDPFQASGCRDLRFRPRLRLALTGRRQTRTGGHPGVRAVLTQRGGQANVKSATTKLPLALALDPKRARSNSLCEFEASKRADCPRSSIVGRARAVSPLLERPLSGRVYFAKNVRVNARGNAIRTLPSLVVALRGEVALNVRANSDSKGGRLISRFPSVPDAPVSRFELTLRGGRKGILQVTKTRAGGEVSICAKRQVAGVVFKGHNARRHDFRLRMKTPCSKRKQRAGNGRGERRR